MSANRVWSRPTPTLFPGRIAVPRCRTIIVPASTTCPSLRLTPSRLPALSRPLRVLPIPFLCAIDLLRSYDVADADLRHDLTMPGLAAVPNLVLVLEDDDLRALA